MMYELRACGQQQLPEILAILNEAIVTSTALYDYKPRTAETMQAWYEAKRTGNYPIIGAFNEQGTLLGFGSYGTFRNWPAYKYTVEHSIYTLSGIRRQGVGENILRQLIFIAQEQQYHVLIGAIDHLNEASIALHQKLGFVHAGTIRQAGYKFGKWLDLSFYQFILQTPEVPVENEFAGSVKGWRKEDNSNIGKSL